MNNNFRFEALSESLFQQYFQMCHEELLSRNAVLLTADQQPGYPCRVSLENAAVGETVLALSYNHHNVESAYRASGPVFVRKQAVKAFLQVGEVPVMLRHRQLSLRGYSSSAIMVTADVVEGVDIEASIYHMLSDSSVEYIHVHNAKPGCFNCTVKRA